MTTDASLIDEIVQRVLRELGTPAAAPRRAHVEVPKPAIPAAVAIEARVITRELLENRVGSATRIHLRSSALVTPSARDYLRERQIEVAVEEALPTVGSVAAPCRVLLTGPAPQVSSALASLRNTGLIGEQRLVGLPAEAASEATSILCRGEASRVVIFTDKPELVACLANRNERVRGAALHDLSALDRLRTSLKPNLLAIDPAGKSEFELSRILKAINTP